MEEQYEGKAGFSILKKYNLLYKEELKRFKKNPLKVYALPIEIGREVPRPSTWFKGYTEKFFFDRGVLYYHLYGKLRNLMAIRFLLAHKGVMCKEIPVKKAYELMCAGMKEAK